MNAVKLQEADEKARIGVEKARLYFQDNPLQVMPFDETDEIVENILLGMEFRVTNINFVTNTVTFKLVK